MKIGIIGAGKVGFTLGKYLTTHGQCVAGFYSRTPDHAKEAAEFTNTKHYEKSTSLISDCDALILSVPDGMISEVYQSIPKDLLKEKIMCHCSGSISSTEAFAGIAEHGGISCSIHPLFPVSDKYKSYLELEDAFFCVEGDDTALDVLIPILEGCGNTVQRISPEVKKLYHCGCAMASNLMMALVGESVKALKGCGFSDEGAIKALAPLMLSNLDHIIHDGPVKALTGPMERNDVNTIKGHLAALGENDTVYKALSTALIDIARERHPETDYGPMRDILKK